MAEMSMDEVIRRLSQVKTILIDEGDEKAFEIAIALLQQEEKQDEVVISTDNAADLSDNEVEDNLRDMCFDEVKPTRDGRLQVTGSYDHWRWFMDYCKQ